MSDFSVYTAEQVADFMSQGTIETPPSELYVAVFDDTGTERSDDFASDGRVSTTTGTDWDIVETGFENANDVDFGEATTDVNNLQEIGLFDAETDGNEIARYDLAGAPFNIAAGTTLVFPDGNITFDVQDRTQ